MQNFLKKVWKFEKSAYLCNPKRKVRVNAEIAQLVEHNLAKVGVASSSLVFRSKRVSRNADLNYEITRRGTIIYAVVLLQRRLFSLYAYDMTQMNSRREG